MASINKVIIVGNLGRDPEMHYASDGTAICTVSVATTSAWKDKISGQRREETEWHRVVMHSRLAEIAGEYLKKGRLVYIEGRLKTRKWQDKKTGAERYSTEIVADQMQMLDGQESSESSQEEPAREPLAPAQQSTHNAYAAQRSGRHVASASK